MLFTSYFICIAEALPIYSPGTGRNRRVRRKARRRRHGEGDDDAGTEDQRLLQQGRGIWGLIKMLFMCTSGYCKR